jgi:hypothetical protein
MAGDAVRVSMYNVGFGDCFLLRFPGPDREHTLLIDCGSIKQGTAGSTDVIVKQLIEDITTEGVARIDVVAMTHRHKDHVSGFGNASWRDVEVGEVWLPWTENPEDDRAREFLNEMAGFASALGEVASVADRLGFMPAERELLDHIIDNTLTLSNEKALATLHRGFKASGAPIPRKYLSRSPTESRSDQLPGVTINVLAPSKDEKVIRDMDPPSSESFLRAVAGLSAEESNDSLPFDRDETSDGQPDEGLKELLRRIANQSALLAAVMLENAVNNTSLMLIFEIGDAALLFPGDSQWGSWKINLEDPVSRALLERTTFYKIGHHGSHNATPVTFVEKVINTPGGPASEVWAAASVAEHGSFTEIPRGPLLTALTKRIGDENRVVRSDKPPSATSMPPGLSVVRANGKVIRLDFEVPV